MKAFVYNGGKDFSITELPIPKSRARGGDRKDTLCFDLRHGPENLSFWQRET